MSERIHKQSRTASGREAIDDIVEVEPVTKAGEKIKTEIDDLLDEIDDVLEVNAEDFVKSYIQKGGE